eukprot:2990703-Alexandrium_andersonii.AAC.1
MSGRRRGRGRGAPRAPATGKSHVELRASVGFEIIAREQRKPEAKGGGELEGAAWGGVAWPGA